MKCILLAAGLIFSTALPSFAQDMTSLQYLLAKGALMHAEFQGQPLDMQVTYNGDGTSSMKLMRRVVAGKWRVDGDMFCASNDLNPVESCFAVPPGKKPGDTFKVTSPTLGEITITINE